MTDETDLRHLRRCVELARDALEAGDEPFGSVLVSSDGQVLAEDHNRVASGDPTRHPEFELARWAAEHLTPEERSRATVYTSTEHCPMCSAAHGWVGLGRIVYASSSQQRSGWLEECTMGVLRALISSFLQSRFSPSGDQEATSPFSREMPFISGPRQPTAHSNRATWWWWKATSGCGRAKAPR